MERISILAKIVGEIMPPFIWKEKKGGRREFVSSF